MVTYGVITASDARRAAPRRLVDIIDATDPALCGGKAIGLAKLERAGCPVPAAVCVTTDFYRNWLDASGLAPRLASLAPVPAGEAAARREMVAKIRLEIEAARVPDDLQEALRVGLTRLGAADVVTVRSSAVHEDDRGASHAGLHTSFVVAAHEVSAAVAAIKACWASLWTDAAWTYRERLGIPHTETAMAVVVQRFVHAACSGVAFSANPLTNDRATVVIEAGWGSSAALVSGTMTPDQFRVTASAGAPPRVRRRAGRQETMTAWRDGREVSIPVDGTFRDRPVLSERQALAIARVVKAVEGSLHAPVDVEWVFDGRQFWAVQARPITTLAAPPPPRAQQTCWTRANLKEVFPELPSPLALSYLGRSLNVMFRTYHAAQGHLVPAGTELVSVFQGRPYLNLTLMQQMTIDRGGDPAIVARLFGGAGAAERMSVAAPPRRVGGMLSHARLAREMLATFFRTPHRGRRLFRRMRRAAVGLRAVRLDALDDEGLAEHLERFSATMLHETTLRRVHEVVSAQSRAYMVLERLVTAWMPSDAESVVKRLMTGVGTLPNVRMTYRLMELGTVAARDARARTLFEGDLRDDAIAGCEAALVDTEVGAGLAAFLEEFGHRGPYESDVMSARFSEDPAPLFRLIQLYLRAGGALDPARHAAERRHVRQAATAEVRRVLRRGRSRLGFVGCWALFSIVSDALQRLLALRDECRHVTTLLVAHLRRVALEIGARATRQGRLTHPDDVFFLTLDELPRVLTGRDRAWDELADARRRERERNARLEGPDLIRGDGTTDGTQCVPDTPTAGEMTGCGVSPGTVIGRIRVVRSAEDIGQLFDEIAVFPAIEPTLTPIFPLVRGLIAEMGGLLSHAAILARECGVPAVVSVPDATRRLRDGDRVELDGTTGRIRVLQRAA